MVIQAIHEQRHGIASKVMIAFVCVVFAAFGIDAFFSGGKQIAVKVNGDEISELRVANGIERQRQYLLRTNDGVSASMLEDEVLRGPIVEGLVEQQLVLQQLRKHRLVATKEQVDAFIVNEEAFAGEDGKFSAERYKQVLRMSGINPSDYRLQVSDELAVQQLRSGLLMSDFITQAELDRWYRIFAEKRDIRWLKIPIDNNADMAVSDAELKAWYEANSADYFSKEAVKVDYLILDPKTLIDPVTNKDIAERYKKEIGGTLNKPERQAAHIMLDLDTAKAEVDKTFALIKQKLEQGESFASLAKTYSEDPGSAANGGLLGYSKGDSFPAEFEKALSTLKVGEVSAPVKTEAGYHIIKLLDLRKAEPVSLAESKERIKNELTEERLGLAHSTFVTLSEELANITFNSDGLESAADELELKIQRSNGFIQKDSSEGIFKQPQVQAAIFSKLLVEDKHNSDLIELEDGRIAVFFVSQYKPAELQPFTVVKNAVVAAVKAHKAQAQVQATAQKLIEEIKQGDSLPKVAKEYNYPWQVKLQTERFDKEMPEVLLKEAFERDASKDQGLAILNDADAVYVMQISNVREGKAKDIAPMMMTRMKQGMAASKGEENYQVWLYSLVSEAKIDVINSSTPEQ